VRSASYFFVPLVVDLSAIRTVTVCAVVFKGELFLGDLPATLAVVPARMQSFCHVSVETIG